jgi:multidrug efflux system membrane fusion protein
MNFAFRTGWLCLPLGILLTACGSAPEPTEVVRPVLAVQPQVAASRFDSFAGEIHARYEPTLAFRVAGKVATRRVDSGDRVTAGQVLATLDAEDLRLQVDAASAQLAAAEADLALAQAEQTRYANLLDRQLISKSQFDQVNTRMQAAKAQLEAARAQRNVSANQAAYSELRAPADGVIAKRLIEAGQVVTAGQAAFVLAQDGEREVAISIPERDAAKHAVGQLVRVMLWSQPEQPQNGSIRELSPTADAASRTFAARIQIDATVENIELGGSARVFIGTGEGTQLALPLSAINADAGEAFVWVIQPENAQLQKRVVTLGAMTETDVPVLNGVTSADWVVAGGVHLLHEGQTVRAVDRDNRAVQLRTATQGG